MQVKEIMTRDIETINSDSMLNEAAKKMKSLDVGVLPVLEGSRIAGIITGRDIIIRAVAEDRDPQTTSVAEIMTPEVTCCSENESIEEAARIMEDRHIHRVVVLDKDNRSVGILSLSDIAVKAGNEHLACELLECVAGPAHPNR